MNKNNEEIIIDDVDVSVCEHYDEVCLGNHHYKWCKDNNNCYYKQLKRKEQECKELKNTVDYLRREFKKQKQINHAISRSYKNLNCKDLQKLKADNEELKKLLMQKSEVDMFLNTPIEGWSNDPCGVCPHKAENEQLKEELSAIQHNCNREGCRYYNDGTFKVFYECKAQKALQLSANSITTKYCDLLQTLEEIREIAGQLYYQAIKDPVKREAAIYKIISKINEVEDE